LAKTDSSRQQIYLAGDFSALNLLPFGRFESDASNRGGGRTERLKATLQLDWITPDGSVLPAPNANLILYPKYPEVRLSGVLNGVPDRHPSTVIANKKEGRWLFLGIGLGMRILAYAAAAEDPCAQWALQNSGGVAQNGVFFDFTAHLLAGWVSIQGRLSEISRKGWIASKRLDANGMEHPCNSENCGGYTLEAELGIIPNARAEPDFAGWEVKQFAVSDLERPVGVSGRSKPARDGRMKTSHFEVGVALGAAGAADQRDEPTQREPATFHRHAVGPGLVRTQGRP
jgi:hypothetical protein